MGIMKKISHGFIRVVEVVETLLIAGIVGVMLYVMVLWNFFNKSFRSSTELCGFMFMWMAFLGVCVLYDRDRLITLDMLYVRAPQKVKDVMWYINKIFSFALGIVMIVAYKGMYPITKTSYFSTMQWLSKAWHFLPMAIAGAYIAFRTIIQVYDKITSGKAGAQ